MDSFSLKNSLASPEPEDAEVGIEMTLLLVAWFSIRGLMQMDTGGGTATGGAIVGTA